MPVLTRREFFHATAAGAIAVSGAPRLLAVGSTDHRVACHMAHAGSGHSKAPPLAAAA